MNNLNKHLTELLANSAEALSAISYGFLSTPAGKEYLLEHPISSTLKAAPESVLAGGIAGIKLLLTTKAAYRYATAANKNLGKTLSLAQAMQETILLSAGACLETLAKYGIAGNSVTAVPVLFLCVEAAKTAANTALLCRAIINYRHSATDPELRMEYKRQIVRHAVATLTSAIATAAITSLLVAGISNPIGLAIMAGVGIAALAINYFVERKLNHAPTHTASSVTNKSVKTLFHKKASTKAVLKAVTANTPAQGNYEFVASYANVFQQAKQKGVTPLKNAMTNVINMKIRQLKKQSTTDKRAQKINALRELRHEVRSLNSERKTVAADTFTRIEKHNPRMFQSFFKRTGDVEAIFSAARVTLVAA